MVVGDDLFEGRSKIVVLIYEGNIVKFGTQP
jgi:hypothetical protein